MYPCFNSALIIHKTFLSIILCSLSEGIIGSPSDCGWLHKGMALRFSGRTSVPTITAAPAAHSPEQLLILGE